MLLDTIHYFIGEMPVFVIAWSENRLHVHNKIWDEARYRIAALGSEEYKAYKKAANTLRESLSLEKRCLIDPLFSDYSDWIKQDVADCLAAKELPETANWLLLALKDQKRLATKLLHRMIVQGQFGDKKMIISFWSQPSVNTRYRLLPSWPRKNQPWLFRLYSLLIHRI